MQKGSEILSFSSAHELSLGAVSKKGIRTVNIITRLYDIAMVPVPKFFPIEIANFR